MNAEIICIGTELLLGRIVNTNAAYLSRKLAELGIDVYHQTTVGDNPARLTEAIRRAAIRSDIIIMTGGLGPTVDDITAETVSNIIGKVGMRKVSNFVGTAPGIIAEWRDKTILCLPGPPRELEPMFEKDIVLNLRKRFKLASGLHIRTVKLTGLAESYVDRKVKDLLKLKPPTTIGIYAKLGEVDLVIMSKEKNAIAHIERKIKKKLAPYIFGYDDETLEGSVGKVLLAKHKTLAVAESCTGGLVASRITDVSGSSKYFKAGVVAYANSEKENLLGVKGGTLKKYGAVSRQVAIEMAAGIKHYACSDIGLGITGIAGPKGGTRAKPIGLVHIALVSDKKCVAKEFRFKGYREYVKFRASQAALDMIRKVVQ